MYFQGKGGNTMAMNFKNSFVTRAVGSTVKGGKGSVVNKGYAHKSGPMVKWAHKEGKGMKWAKK
jgi:hypothetical protein